jgi:hypothetical protein
LGEKFSEFILAIARETCFIILAQKIPPFSPEPKSSSSFFRQNQITDKIVKTPIS